MRGYNFYNKSRNPYRNNLIINGQDTSKWTANEITEYNNEQDPVKKNMLISTINSRIANENNVGVKYGSLDSLKDSSNSNQTESTEKWFNTKKGGEYLNAASGVMNSVADGIIPSNDYADSVGLTDRRKTSTQVRGVISGVAGAINPIVGAGVAAGNLIGGIVRNNVEKIDSQGKLKNPDATSAFATVGGILDPAGAGIEAMADPNATFLDKLGSFSHLGGIGYKRRLQKSLKEERENRRGLALAQNKPIDEAELQQESYKGYEDADYYLAGGGVLPTSENSGQVIGDSHEQGGVPVGDATLEGGEVIYKDKVFSKRLPSSTGKSFADEANILIKEKEKYKYNNDKFNNGTSERKNEIIEAKLNKLFLEQEQFKQINGISDDMGFGNNAAAGGTRKFSPYYVMPSINSKTAMREYAYNNNLDPDSKYESSSLINNDNNSMYKPSLYGIKYNNLQDEIGENKLFNSEEEQENFENNLLKKKKENNKFQAMQYLSTLTDNVANAILTAKTPKIPNPVLLKQTPLVTKVNYYPALQANRDNLMTGYRFINNNTADSNAGVARASDLMLKSMQNNNDIVYKAKALETELQNKNIQEAARINELNNRKINENIINKYNKKSDINSKISSNVANFETDVKGFIKDKNDYNLNRAQLALIAKRFQGSNVFDRNFLESLSLGELNMLGYSKDKNGNLIDNTGKKIN